MHVISRTKNWAAVEGTETDAKKILKAKSKLILSLHESMYVHIQGLTTAKEVWDALKNAFNDKGLTRRTGWTKKSVNIWSLFHCNKGQILTLFLVHPVSAF
jgi:hypothetical protein